jgi:hypothetical protein
METKIRAFWDVTLCSVMEVDRRFRGAYYLHHQGDVLRYYTALHSTRCNLHIRRRLNSQIWKYVKINC